MSIRLVSLKDIDFDSSPHTRYEIRDDVVEDYSVEYKKKNPKLPMPDLFIQGKGPFFLVADGLHRCHAAMQAGLDQLVCQVHIGDYFACLRFAANCNITHGLRRSQKDKQCVVESLLMQGGTKFTNNVLSEMCGIDPEYIAKIRKLLEEVGSVEPVKQRVDAKGNPVMVRTPKVETKDYTGFKIPEPLIPLWQRRFESVELQKEIDALKKRLSLAHSMNDPLYAEVDFEAVAACLQKLKHTLGVTFVWAVCSQCQGHPDTQPKGKCPMCLDRGLCSEFRYKSCTPKEIQELRKKVSDETPALPS